MSVAPAAVPGPQVARRGRLWWLPGSGQGNGLDDDAWVPALEVSQQIVPVLLEVLRDAGVPGYAAPARPAAARLRARSGYPGTFRLWVGASAYGEAESALLAVMPQLAREAARRADSAWR